MKPGTRERLDAVNRVFYAAQAEAFAASRDHAWPGWERALAALPPLRTGGRVLDVGCGNGRLARFLAARLPQPFAYTGLDASAPLLAAARTALAPLDLQLTLAHADVVNEPPAAWLPRRPFDWIAVFGLLHHVPGAATRRRLLAGLAAGLRPGGVLMFAVWRFTAFERFRRRIVPWQALDGIDPAELEPGDHLLRWGAEHVRYCHALGGAELEDLLAALSRGHGHGTRVLARFDADGREGTLNHYVLLQRPQHAGEERVHELAQAKPDA